MDPYVAVKPLKNFKHLKVVSAFMVHTWGKQTHEKLKGAKILS